MTANISDLSGKLFLIVDDEELVREVAVMMIEEAGGVALTARGGVEAVEVFKVNHQKLAVVLMDFSMPNLDGFQAFEQMQVVNPAVPVVLVSGLKITPEAEAARTTGRLGFLNKPFKQDDVLRVISRALESRK